MDKWYNKVAIVTGASAGIGKDISIKLVNHGMKVVGCARNLDKLLQVKSEISKESKGQFIPFQCDITKEEDVLKMFDFVKKTYKELSILINNAGTSFDGSILHGKTEDWRVTFETNVLGLCMCSREAYALMKDNEISNDKSHIVPGHIINIGSILSHIVEPFTWLHFYTASKFAVKAITESIRQELREINSKIRVTQISSGLVNTSFYDDPIKAPILKKLDRIFPDSLEPCDISDAIIFALSADARSSVHDIILRITK